MIVHLAVMAALLAGTLLPDSTLKNVLTFTAFGYIVIDLALRARAGYRRRLPHWTPDSWRRFYRFCAIPIGAMLMFVGMMVALEYRLPLTGAARSIPRAVWAGATVMFGMIGAIGLVIAVGKLTDGDPTRQLSGSPSA